MLRIIVTTSLHPGILFPQIMCFCNLGHFIRSVYATVSSYPAVSCNPGLRYHRLGLTPLKDFVSRGCRGGGGDLVATMPVCVCRKVKDMSHFLASSE